MTTDRYARTREHRTFRNGTFARWQRAQVAVIGAGMLGSRLAPEIVRSGARVGVCDFDRVEPHNLATQAVRPGMSKVDAVTQACTEIRPDSATGHCVDIRHIGIGVLRQFDLLVDCTDDGQLAYPLTEIANGLGKPLLRVAVDGSGQHELGRVTCSDARDGGACQLCTRSWSDLAASTNRTPCPGAATDSRPATHAGNGLASVMTGAALLQAQRLVTGNDLELVRDREIHVDLVHFQIMAATIRRSEACISGHTTWELIDIPAAEGTCLGDVYSMAARIAPEDPFRLEPFGHPFCLEAGCACGASQVAVGTKWADPPTCTACGRGMSWRTGTQVASLNRRQAEFLGIQHQTLPQLGLPEEGAMFVIRQPDRPPLRIVLNNTPAAAT